MGKDSRGSTWGHDPNTTRLPQKRPFPLKTDLFPLKNNRSSTAVEANFASTANRNANFFFLSFRLLLNKNQIILKFQVLLFILRYSTSFILIHFF